MVRPLSGLQALGRSGRRTARDRLTDAAIIRAARM